jgi:hypothetical protein
MQNFIVICFGCFVDGVVASKCRVEVQRFGHGSYTLMHDTDPHVGEMALDLVMFVGGNGGSNSYHHHHCRRRHRRHRHHHHQQFSLYYLKLRHSYGHVAVPY